MALFFLYRLVRPVFEAVRVHRLDARAKDAGSWYFAIS